MEQPNLLYVNQLSGEDEAFKNRLISIIKTEFPQEKAVYEKNIAAKNYTEAAENVHKLKHKISILGLEKSFEVAVNFEEHLLEKQTDGQTEFEAILQCITNYLSTI